MKRVYMCFSTDILHNGHIKIIQKAAELGELTVGVLTDEVIATMRPRMRLYAGTRQASKSSCVHAESGTEHKSDSFESQDSVLARDAKLECRDDGGDACHSGQVPSSPRTRSGQQPQASQAPPPQQEPQPQPRSSSSSPSPQRPSPSPPQQQDS
jgi:cytidyltransferase-like protein